MEIKVLKHDKDELEIELDNLTITEALRVYLNKQPEVKFAAWKRTHPTKNPILNIKTKGKTPGKAVQEAVSQIEKEADKIVSDFKKSK